MFRAQAIATKEWTRKPNHKSNFRDGTLSGPNLSAIAGHVTWPQSTAAPSDCEAILRALSRYGLGGRTVRSWHSASLGVLLNPLLPEDDLDQQPLLTNGQLMVADVRLDNRDELARMLGIAPAAAQLHSDSALLFEAWLRWGEASLQRLIGDFAFAVFSAHDNSITLVRDPFGERTLFFARHTDQMAFASMPAALLALPHFRKGLNLRSLARTGGDIHNARETTYLNGISRVLPGQILTFTADHVLSKIYWQPSLEPLIFRSSDDYVEAFRELLDSSVRARLRRRQAPIATQLSSGFDSSAVSATAARLMAPADDLVAYTAAPREGFSAPAPRHRFADESALAAMTARMNGLRHVIVRHSGSALSPMREMIRLNQDPFYNYMNLGWIVALGREVKSSGAHVYLSGEYGNLTVHAGGLRVLGDFLREGRFLAWARESRLAAQRQYVSWRGVLINSLDTYLPNSLTAFLYRRATGRRRRESSVFLRPEWVADLTREMESAATPVRSASSRQIRLDVLRTLDLGVSRKGTLAMFGIDERSPLGDRRLVEFGLRLPLDQLLCDGKSRPLARTALADRVPAEVLTATRRGYQAADWFERFDVREIGEMIDEIGGASSVRELVDIQKMREALANWPSGGFETYDIYQRFAVDLPLALATGFFVLEAEKWLAGRFD